MAWLEIHQSLVTHRKTLEAAELLGIRPPHMMGCMISLWMWALDNAPDGDLIGLGHQRIAKAAQWHGRDTMKFLEVLSKVHFLDNILEGLFIHNWTTYTGKLIDVREKTREQNRVRQQRRRTSKGKESRVTDRDGHGPTLPYQTLPNQTDRDRTGTSSPFIAAFFQLYSENIGNITAEIRHDVVDLDDEHECPVEWAKESIKEACALNVRNWPYVRAILERLAAESPLEEVDVE